MLAEISVNLFAAIFAEHKHTPFCPPFGGLFLVKKKMRFQSSLRIFRKGQNQMGSNNRQ